MNVRIKPNINFHSKAVLILPSIILNVFAHLIQFDRDGPIFTSISFLDISCSGSWPEHYCSVSFSWFCDFSIFESIWVKTKFRRFETSPKYVRRPSTSMIIFWNEKVTIAYYKRGKNRRTNQFCWAVIISTCNSVDWFSSNSRMCIK